MQFQLLSTLLVSFATIGGLASPVQVARNSSVLPGEATERSSGELTKRFSGSRWSWYDVGLGACGQTNVESDFIVALNAQQFGSGYPGPQCFKTITLKYNGKSATAKVMDMCPGCPYGGLDLSKSLFKHFADESVGIIHGDWEFTDGTGGGTIGTTTKAAPAPSSSKAPVQVAPTTISKAPAASSAAPKPATTTSATSATPKVSNPNAGMTSSRVQSSPSSVASSAQPTSKSPIASPSSLGATPARNYATTSVSVAPSTSSVFQTSTSAAAPTHTDDGELEDCEEEDYEQPAGPVSPSATASTIVTSSSVSSSTSSSPSPTPSSTAASSKSGIPTPAVAAAPVPSASSTTAAADAETNLKLVNELLSQLAALVKTWLAEAKKDA